MNESRLFTRITLRRDAPIASLRSVLVPEHDEKRAMVGHQLMWTLFGDRADRTRDFLWRDAGSGVFYTVSERAPEDQHGLFDIAEPKEYAPCLVAGDRLTFVLRANATVSRKSGGESRGKPADVVMNALHAVPRGHERADARARAVQEAGLRWLGAQGARNGFDVERADGEETPVETVVMNHRVLRVDHKGAGMTLGILDFAGTLVVREPDSLRAALFAGIGRAKAFGCGMILVKRA